MSVLLVKIPNQVKDKAISSPYGRVNDDGSVNTIGSAPVGQPIFAVPTQVDASVMLNKDGTVLICFKGKCYHGTN